MARPNLSYLKNLILALIGLPLGIWTALTGMGPSVYAAPTVRWLIGLKDRRLASLTLLLTIVASGCSFVTYGQSGYLHFWPALLFAFMSVVGATIGSSAVMSPYRDTQIAAGLWAAVVIALGSSMIYYAPKIAGAPGQHDFDSAGLHLGNDWLHLAVIGLATGFFGRVAGLGGVLAVPLLVLTDHALPLAGQALALLTMFIVSVAPAASYVARDEIAPQPSFWTCTGAALGGLIGARIAITQPNSTLLAIYGVGLFLVGVLRLFSTPPPALQAPPEKTDV